MNTLTHLGISQIVQRNIENQFNVRLNKIGFMYGNIKPDISASLGKIPHFKDESFDFIKEEIRELMNMRIDGFNKCSRFFSEKLGVIMHYLSDYFCYAHSKKFNGTIVDHYFYEAKLSQYYKANFNLTNNYTFSKAIEVTTDYKYLLNLIEEFYTKYSSTIVSFESDLLYTLKICTSISLSIILSCMENGTKTVA